MGTEVNGDEVGYQIDPSILPNKQALDGSALEEIQMLGLIALSDLPQDRFGSLSSNNTHF